METPKNFSVSASPLVASFSPLPTYIAVCQAKKVISNSILQSHPVRPQRTSPSWRMRFALDFDNLRNAQERQTYPIYIGILAGSTKVDKVINLYI